MAGRTTTASECRCPCAPHDTLVVRTPPGLPRARYKGFINISVRGTRFYQHNVFVYPAADAAFCNQTVPKGKRNAFGAGLCGVNGGAKSFEAFGTSSYEKDGSMIGLPGARW